MCSLRTLLVPYCVAVVVGKIYLNICTCCEMQGAATGCPEARRKGSRRGGEGKTWGGGEKEAGPGHGDAEAVERGARKKGVWELVQETERGRSVGTREGPCWSWTRQVSHVQLVAIAIISKTVTAITYPLYLEVFGILKWPHRPLENQAGARQADVSIVIIQASVTLISSNPIQCYGVMWWSRFSE